MERDYKGNWQETRERFVAWWERRNTDRPLLILTAPKPGDQVHPTPTRARAPDEDRIREVSGVTYRSDLEKRWLDISRILDGVEAAFERTYFFAEAFPYMWANLGPGSFGLFVGATPVFQPDTVWYEPCFDDIEKAELQLQRDSPWWKWSIAATQIAVERAQNRYLVAIPDLIENLDTLAAILGTEKLLYYLIDASREVHRLQRQLLSLWFEAYNEHYEIVKDQDGWSSFAAFSIWGPGKTAKLQCDISAMLSPAMFDEFVLPYLKEQCDALDYTIYHLDGPGAVCHLDSILSIESLDCVQWTPGAGAPDGGDPCWDGIYRKVLDAGKCIHAGMPITRVKDFVERLGKTGVHIGTRAATPDEARELLNSF